MKIADRIASRFVKTANDKKAYPYLKTNDFEIDFEGVSSKFEGKIELNLGNLEPIISTLEDMGHPEGEDFDKLSHKDLEQNFHNLWAKHNLSKKISDLIMKNFESSSFEIQDVYIYDHSIDVDLRDFKKCKLYMEFGLEYVPLDFMNKQKYSNLTENIIKVVTDIFK